MVSVGDLRQRPADVHAAYGTGFVTIIQFESALLVNADQRADEGEEGRTGRESERKSERRIIVSSEKALGSFPIFHFSSFQSWMGIVFCHGMTFVLSK